MILLFEGYPYPTALISRYLQGLNLDGIKQVGEHTIIKYVGYFLLASEQETDMAFLLPKVLIYNKDDESAEQGGSGNFLAFGEFKPEDIIECKSLDKLSAKNREFVYTLSTWIYLTIRRYNSRNPGNDVCLSTMSRAIASKSSSQKEATLLDVVLALIKFGKEHHDFITFVKKSLHSGYNKPNWRRTVAKEMPFLSDETPVYLSTVTKRRTVNYDEELLVVFYSVLQDIKKAYGFTVPSNEGFRTMSAIEYRMFCKSAVRRLRKMKQKYFSDTTIELWELLYNYFSLSDHIHSGKKTRDLLLAKSFHAVFEDMIDYLISDESYPKELKDHVDGKRVDHLYRDKSLMSDNEIFFVGDSKYYKAGREIEKKSVGKQFTYARNIIQRNIEVVWGFDKDCKHPEQYLQYRDPFTEGYNITPNFFISGVVRRNTDKTFDYHHFVIEPVSGDGTACSRQFGNRLFDRDTLLLQRYNINFLYVLSAYTRKSERTRRAFQVIARKLFRNGLLDMLDSLYDLYVLKPQEGIDLNKAIQDNFYVLQGKIFRPYENSQLTYMALEKKADNTDVLRVVNKFFIKEPCGIWKAR